MATYTNQIPANLKPGDIINLTNSNVTYEILKKFLGKVTVTAGAGGAGGKAVWNGNGATSSGAGGSGGVGGRAIFQWLFEVSALVVPVVGANGGNGGNYGVEKGDFASGQTGGTGGTSSLSINGITIASTKGGGGGSGGSLTVDSIGYGYNPTSGSPGAAGSVSLIPAGGTQTTGSPAGITIEVLSANEPPTAPGGIGYGIPYAAKPLDLTLTPATDPD